MNSVNMDPDQWQRGKTKVFIKSPESLFLLEEMRDRKYNEYAVVLQKAFRKFNAIQYFLKLKNEAADLLYGKKERRALSLNRKFYGDYIGLDRYAGLRALLGKRETVEFAQTCDKLDRRFKRQKRDFVLTNKAVYIIGREQQVKSKTSASVGRTFVEVVKRRMEYAQVGMIVLSTCQDNLVVIYPRAGGEARFASVLDIEFKTEFLTTFSKRFKEATGGTLSVQFSDK
jgi:myosin-1